MSLTIKIRVNKTSNGSPVIYDVSNDLIINSLLPEERADFSLEAGTFKIISSVINYNIPPYSICEIFDGVRYFYYCVSSECNSYLTTGKWVHDCKLLALESLLECYALGAKTYSLNNVGSDYQICQFTTNLLKLQDNGFVFDTSYSYSLLVNAHNEYTFPDGTTFYEAFKQIANKNKIRLNLSIYNNSFTSNDLYFKIALMGENMASYDIVDTDGALSFKMLQNVEDYCKYLLTCGSDVVDRDNKTWFENLTVRALNGVAVDADSAVFLLPTRVEGITKFEVNSNIGILNLAIHCSGWTTDYVDYWQDPDQPQGITIARTLHDWRTSGNYSWYWEEIYRKWFRDLDDSFDNAYFVIEYNQSNEIWASMTTSSYTYSGTIDMTEYILEKNVFDALDVAEQPKYVVYESGGNNIFNLNASYKRDFWNMVVGTSRTGMFDPNTKYDFIDSFTTTEEIEFSAPIVTDYDISYKYYLQKNAMQSSVNVECVPITNPILIDEKNDTPDNEDSYKPMTRTYSMGDNNGLIVDFKALTNDIDKQNETLGKVEAVLEVDSSKLYTYELDDDDNEVEVEYTPRPNDEIHFYFKGTNYTFYISSIVKRFTATKMIYQLNLTKTRFKIADAIGVDYQFNPTYLPLENVVERALFFEVVTLYPETILSNSVILINLTINNTSYSLRPAIMKCDDYWVLYAEAMDNIVLGMATEYYDTNHYKLINVTYGDENASFVNIGVDIKYGYELNMTDSRLLPFGARYTPLTTLQVVENKKVYKDSREKLTFTIKVRKPRLI